MTTSVLVLCDGGRSSTRALQLAVCPGAILPEHVGTRVIVIHVCETAATPTNPLSNATGDRSGLSPSAAAACAAKSISPIPTHANSWNRSPGTAGAANDSSLEPHGINSNNSSHSLRHMESPSAVMEAVLDVIYDSKVTRDTLNYKLEMADLSQLSGSSSECGEGVEAAAGREGLVPSGHTSPTSFPAAQPRPANGRSNAAGEHDDGDTLGSGGSAPRNGLEEPEPARRHAERIVRYVRSRVARHDAQVILLGTGDGQQKGKSVCVGSVAKSAMRLLKSRYTLYFVKADGPLIRPWYNNRTGYNHDSNISSTNHDHILSKDSVTPETVLHASATSHTRSAIRYVVVVVAAHTRSVAEEGAADHDRRSAMQQRGCSSSSNVAEQHTYIRDRSVESAVRYALRRRRVGSADAVEVVVVVTEPTHLAARSAETDESENTDVAAVQRVVQALWVREFGGSETCEHETTAAAAAAAAGAGASFAPHDVSSVMNRHTDDRGVHEDDDDNEENATRMGRTTAAAASSAQPPLVQRCVLRPTKHLPEPTIYNAGTGQVVKFVQSGKPDYIVTSSSIATPLQYALLAMPKSHCIVVPDA